MHATLFGYSDRRPANFQPIDRAALMRHAHQIARASRVRFATYAEALSYGLRAAWMSAKSGRQIQSLSAQAGCPAIPFTAAQIAASREATRRTGSSMWAA
jgi:hypothetical protein